MKISGQKSEQNEILSEFANNTHTSKTSSSAGYARKATIEAAQENPDRKTWARTTNAPHSEIKTKEGGKGQRSNQINKKMRYTDTGRSIA